MSSQASAVANWYDQNVALEDSRLELGRLEFAVTTHYIQEAISKVQQHIDKPNALRIADIGCGTGVYAIPLAKAAHEVTICDVSSAELSLAKQKAQESGISFQAASAFDAREIAQHAEVYKEGYYEIVLLLGPLYHITDEAQRLDVLRTALRTLRPGGALLATFVTRNAHLRDVATRDPERLDREFEFYSRYLQDGKYTRGTNVPMHHATLDEIRRMLREVECTDDVKVESVKLVSCEGFLGFQHGSHLAKLDDECFRKWLDIILASAEDESTLGAADHLLAVLQRHL